MLGAAKELAMGFEGKHHTETENAFEGLGDILASGRAPDDVPAPDEEHLRLVGPAVQNRLDDATTIPFENRDYIEK
jgi:hypothetical protein